MCDELSAIFNPIVACGICGEEDAVLEEPIPGMEYANVALGERCAAARMTTPLWAFRAMTAMLFSSERPIPADMERRLVNHLVYLSADDPAKRLRLMGDTLEQGQQQVKLIPQDPKAVVEQWT